MERIDRDLHRAGVVCTASGVVAMVVWTATEPGAPASAVVWAAVGVVAAACCAQLGSPRTRWWGARTAGVIVGLLLVGAVADRFGLLGGPGNPGVSWGDWAHFRSETAQLVPWQPLVDPAAVAATASEVVLGSLLVAGVWWRWTGAAAAGLFLVYAVAMIPGMGADSLLEYGLPVLIGACLLAAARGPRPRGGAGEPDRRSARTTSVGERALN